MSSASDADNMFSVLLNGINHSAILIFPVLQSNGEDGFGSTCESEKTP